MYVPAGVIGDGSSGHPDAVNDGTDTNTQSTTSTVVCHVRQVSLGVKGYSLQPQINQMNF